MNRTKNLQNSSKILSSSILILAFDFGTRKIGIATGQTLTKTATPIATLYAVRNRPNWKGIEQLIKTWIPAALVVGIPYNMDDSDNEMTLAAQRFGRQLMGRFQLPVHWVDERLSTREAAQIAGKQTRYGLDAIAAQLILETWFSMDDP